MSTINQNYYEKKKKKKLNDAMFGFFLSFLVGQGMFDLILLPEIVHPRLHYACNLCFIKGELNRKMIHYYEHFNN
jgi:hypothetical protein